MDAKVTKGTDATTSADSSPLPEELLELVFARLPSPDINRLRCLSKEWRRKMTKKSRFKQLCADAYPKLFASITRRGMFYGADWKKYRCPGMTFGVRVFDLKLNRWSTFGITPGYNATWNTMRATDGGLVCFVCTSEKKRVPILVCNLLTQDWRALPLHALQVLPRMVQLVMDRVSKSYKVIVVGNRANGDLVAELYHSSTGVWTNANLSADLVSGYQFR